MPTLLCAETTCHAPRGGRRSLYCAAHGPAARARRLTWRPAPRDAAEQALAHRVARRAVAREAGDENRVGTARLMRTEAVGGQWRFEFEFELTGWDAIAVRKSVITRPEAVLRHRRAQVLFGGRVVVLGNDLDPVPYHDATGLPGAVARALRHPDLGRA